MSRVLVTLLMEDCWLEYITSLYQVISELYVSSVVSSLCSDIRIKPTACDLASLKYGRLCTDNNMATDNNMPTYNNMPIDNDVRKDNNSCINAIML